MSEVDDLRATGVPTMGRFKKAGPMSVEPDTVPCESCGTEVFVLTRSTQGPMQSQGERRDWFEKPYPIVDTGGGLNRMTHMHTRERCEAARKARDV